MKKNEKIIFTFQSIQTKPLRFRAILSWPASEKGGQIIDKCNRARGDKYCSKISQSAACSDIPTFQLEAEVKSWIAWLLKVPSFGIQTSCLNLVLVSSPIDTYIYFREYHLPSLFLFFRKEIPITFWEKFLVDNIEIMVIF